MGRTNIGGAGEPAENRPFDIAAPRGTSQVLAALLVLGIGWAWWCWVKNIAEMTAWSGFSMISVINTYFHPENFVRDFPAGYMNYLSSAFTYVLLGIHKYFGVDPESIVPATQLFEIFIITVAYRALVRPLFPNASWLLVLMCSLLFVASNITDMDLARVGPYLHGKVNNVSRALQLGAIAAGLAGRPLLAGSLLGISYINNPLYAVMGGGFLFGAVVGVSPRSIPWRRWIGAGGIFVAIAGAWAWAMYDPAAFTLGDVSRDYWFALCRLSSYHWFPVDYGIFTNEHRERFLSLLCFGLLLLTMLRRQGRELDRRVLIGMLVMLLSILIGIANDVWSLSQTLTKAQVMRSDEIIIAVGMVYVVAGLLSDVMRPGSGFRRALALGLLVSPFLLKPGFPLFPVLAYLAFDFVRPSVAFRGATGRCLLALLALTLLCLLWWWDRGWIVTWDPEIYWGGEQLVNGILIATVVFALFDHFAEGAAPLLSLPVRAIAWTIVVLCSLAGAVSFMTSQKNSQEAVQRVAAFKDVQLWARDHTQPTALFMVDPNIEYGWRDFSLRSSFGTPREWLYTWTATNNNFRAYEEGRRRFAEFGLRVEDYFGRKPSLSGLSEMARDVKDRYYGLGDDWRRGLASRYGVDYFVVKNSLMKVQSNLPVAYHNDYYTVLSSGRNDN